VRWPAKRAEPFGFALNFLLLFLSKRKSKEKLHQGKKWNRKPQEKKNETYET
jgi:hypothetical protein